MSSFDGVSRVYRTLEYIAFGRALEHARFMFVERLRECRRILLIGDGDGRFLRRLLDVAPQASVRSLDLSAAMLELAARRLSPASRARVTFEQADVRAATFAPDSYDAVVTMFVLDCFQAQDVASLAERLARSLRPGGIWLFADFSIPERGWRRLRARMWVGFLYAFFRWRAGLPVRELPPSEALLRGVGLHVTAEATLQQGLLRSVVFETR